MNFRDQGRVWPLVVIAAVGCSKGDERPRYILNTPQVIKAGEADANAAAPSPTIAVVEPAAGSTFDRGEEFQCAARLVASGGARMPEVVHVYLQKGDVSYGGPYRASLLREEGEVATLEARVKAPRTPGRYTLRAQAIQTTFIEPKAASGEPDVRTNRIYSTRVEIEVRP